MSLSPSEAYDRLSRAAGALDRALAVDRGSVHWRDGAYPGVEVVLAYQGAHALFFIPAADIADAGWEARLRECLQAALRYLQEFPRQARTLTQQTRAR